MDNNFDKNPKFSKDLNVIDEINVKTKIFNFYFFVLRKKDFNIFICSLLLIIETIQLISYSFTEPHLKNWKIKESRMDNISLLVGASRITPIFKYIDYDLYIIIYFGILAYIFLKILSNWNNFYKIFYNSFYNFSYYSNQ